MNRTNNFPEKDWNCQCPLCKREVLHKMEPFVMEHVQAIREYFDRPMFITSAYRCDKHPIEAKKSKPGMHNTGLAIDIAVGNGAEAAAIIAYAIKHLAVVGFAYGGKHGFVHLDWREGALMTWAY